MFDRVTAKNNAKDILRMNYWMYLGVSSILVLVASLANLFDSFFIQSLVALLIYNPLIIGWNRVFLDGKNQSAKATLLFSGFVDHYLNGVKIMFIMIVKIFLWSLLFIIPGIIKSYEYFWIPFILADQPTISSKDAFALSKKLSENAKLDTFVLELSFIGWIILGFLCCGIGVIFVIPYIQATYTEVYVTLCEKHAIPRPTELSKNSVAMV